MEDIQDIVDRAVKNAPDYSVPFSRKVAALAQRVEDLTGLAVVHGQSMDYCPGQYVGIRLGDDAGRSPRTRFEARFYISSKADLFFVYLSDALGRTRNHRGNSHPLAVDALPAMARHIVFAVRNLLVENSYREVPYALYDKQAAGCLTQLDGLPATIFEALFAEIV